MDKSGHQKDIILKALESSLGVVTTACKTADIPRSTFYKWLKDDEDFAKSVNDIELMAQDFIKSKYYECVKDKIPSVVLHAAKTKLGWNEKHQIDLTSGNEPIQINIKLTDED
jgi:predicted transcriptional regulator